MVGDFAALALLLAFLGIYGVVSFSAGRPTHEIGVWMALGAGRVDVGKRVIKESMGTCLIGLLLGIAGVLAARRLISVLPYGAKAAYAGTFAEAVLFVAVVVLLASYIPARKAAAVEPARSLRYE